MSTPPEAQNPEEGDSTYRESRPLVLVFMWGGPIMLGLLFTASLVKAVDGERLVPPNLSTQLTAGLVIVTVVGWIAFLQRQTAHRLSREVRAALAEHRDSLARHRLDTLINGASQNPGDSPHLRSVPGSS